MLQCWRLGSASLLDSITRVLPSVSDMAMGHIAGLAFGGLQPHSPSEHVEDPNVLVIHSVKVCVYTALCVTDVGS